MSVVLPSEAPSEVVLQPLGLDQERGKQGVWLFIGSEAFLFMMLFFTYFFLSFGDWRWLREEPPKLSYAIIMLAVLLSSSVILRWGEKQVERDRFVQGRIALGVTIFLGLVFLGLSALDYADHLQHVTPQASAYGSIFYTITSFHVAHLIVGLLMLAYVLILPRVGRTDRPPHRAYSDAAMYWHFVDAVWVFIVGLLYVLPNIR
jgi:cytochrome c oxidase subunit III